MSDAALRMAHILVFKASSSLRCLLSHSDYNACLSVCKRGELDLAAGAGGNQHPEMYPLDPQNPTAHVITQTSLSVLPLNAF